MRRSGADPAGSPSTVTVPDLTICTPTMARMRVVLPLPLGPSSPVTLPRGIAQVNAVQHRALAALDDEVGDLDRGVHVSSDHR